MTGILILGAAVAAAVTAIVVVYALRAAQAARQREQSIVELSHQMQQFTQQFFGYLQGKDQQYGQLSGEMKGQLAAVTEQLFSTRDMFDRRLDQSHKVLTDLHHSLGVISQMSERIFSVGTEVAELQQILRAPKLRGVMGEMLLGELLAEILPADYFRLQHAFTTGERVDAAVFLRKRVLAIDAKFPLENFQRVLAAGDDAQMRLARRRFIADVKKHIDAIAAKYILPDEGTLDVAFMYIPAENVYYELFIRAAEGNDAGADLNRYAFTRKVIPVSPNTFFAFLQLILFGLKGMRLEENARFVLEQLLSMRDDLGRFAEDFGVLGKHITNIKNKYEDVERRLGRFSEKLAGLEERQQPAGPAPAADRFPDVP